MTKTKTKKSLTDLRQAAELQKLANDELNSIVDALGEVKARIADLEATEKELKEAILAADDGTWTSIEGQLFRATVSHSEVRNTDWRAVVEGLEMTPALKRRITVNTKVSDRVTVRVVSR